MKNEIFEKGNRFLKTLKLKVDFVVIGGGMAGAGRYADAVVEFDPFIHKIVEDARGVKPPHAAALQHKSAFHHQFILSGSFW